MLFDDRERSDHTPARHAESEFEFLNRSARPAAERVRAAITTWWLEIPERDQTAFAARLRHDFPATFYELVLHALLTRHPCEVHLHAPEASKNDHRPDFFATHPGGQQVILEATLTRDVPASEAAQDARRGRLYDQINEIESDFFIVIRRINNPDETQPAGRRVVAFLRRELATRDVRVEREHLERDSSWRLPSSVFVDGRLEIEFEFIPKSEELWGTTRSIGIYPSKARWGGSSGSLRSAIERKATRYGDVEYPFIVAVNSLSSWGCDHEDVLGALFGPSSVVATRGLQGYKEVRFADGAFVAPDGAPHNTRVSGVAVGFLVPWNLAQARIRLYSNPFAQRPLDDIPWRLDRIIPGEGVSELLRGETVGEVLELPDGWPGELFE